MQHIPYATVSRRAARSRVCTICADRPAGSESLDAETPRACEPQCTVFANLDTIAGIVARTHSTSLGDYELALRNVVCSACVKSPTHGDFCADNLARTCPLSRHFATLVEALAKLEDHRKAI